MADDDTLFKWLVTQGPLEPESLALQRIRLGLTGTGIFPPAPLLLLQLLLFVVVVVVVVLVEPLLLCCAGMCLALMDDKATTPADCCCAGGVVVGAGLVSRDLMNPGRGIFRLLTTSGVAVDKVLLLCNFAAAAVFRPDGILPAAAESVGNGGVDSLNFGLADRSRNEMLPPPPPEEESFVEEDHLCLGGAGDDSSDDSGGADGASDFRF